ncbi:hypothetical protein H0H87_002281 [Tephrocybe sp. NHM501043]|nr:hypothetical protein H0H87_002281 [Tephrocybe sp. NHM501043]
MSGDSEPRLIVYKAFGIPTDNGVFDDVKSNSLWPGNNPRFPRIFKVVVYTPDGLGVSGINGVAITYQVDPYVVKLIEHGERSGKQHEVDARDKDIIEIIATVNKVKNKIYDLTFILSDGSPHGPFPGDSLPPDTKKEVSAKGIAVGFYGSLCSGMVSPFDQLFYKKKKYSYSEHV